ncbi:MAG: histidine kinase [Clostridiales bacterium]|nr:histidine kinase [Clostridiales bacterium]
MKKIYTWYLNLKLRKKIRLLCFTVGLIPTMILGIFFTIQNRNFLINREKNHLHNILERANVSLNHTLTLHTDIINNLVWDSAIKNAVDSTYSNNYDMFLVNHTVFDSRLPLVQAMHREITGITLYTGTNLYPHNSILFPLTEIQDKPWYQDALTTPVPMYVYEEESNSLLLIHHMPDTIYPNIFIIKLSYNGIFDDYKTLFDDNYAVAIYDQQGELLFSHSELDTDYSINKLFSEHLDRTLISENNQTFFVESTDENKYNWTIRIYRPQKELTSAANSFMFITLGIIIICASVIGYISIKLSRYIVTPLEQLDENLSNIQADNFTVTIQSNYNDEIAHLIQTFNRMAHRLEDTINELFINKLAKQEYHLQMLQSQINPHFLYNCLSMINAKAIRCEQPEISKIALHLSSFYRTTLNKGHNTITVYEEWKNITSYIELQKILHSFSFKVIYTIDEIIFPNRIINLIIQPLVENAIMHGIECREYSSDEIGTISIEGKAEGNYLLFVVTDNGCGMDEKTLNTITTVETKGYGIRNVDQRIKLYFGDTYGISYQSQLGKGTIATICLPMIPVE